MPNKTRSSHYSGGFPDSIRAFSLLDDPRSGRNKRHYFGEIIFIALAAMIAQCDGFEAMQLFARAKESWLKKFLLIPNGTPAADTFRRVLGAIAPKAFNECFIKFTQDLQPELAKQLIAIDGKALRHSFDTKSNQDHFHLISAWACDSGLSLGQLAVDRKSNEITAIPELIDQLDLEGHTVSLDAMGCQKKIARKLYIEKADYLLSLKANHPTLHKRVADFFQDAAFIKQQRKSGKVFSCEDVSNDGHGRQERRIVLATNAIDWIDKNEREEWLGLQSIICVEAHRTGNSSDKVSIQKRYYLSSHKPDATLLQQYIRQHWGIENQCHWVLDVTWNEDASRIRLAHGAENVALLRKMALNLLKLDQTSKDSLKGKRYLAALDENALASFMKIQLSK